VPPNLPTTLLASSEAHQPAGAGVLPLPALGALLGDGRGAVLEGASLLASTVDRPPSPDAELCIRARYVALRRIADFFGIEHNPDPHWPAEPISIDRREFDQVCRELAEAGVALKPDLEQAWRDFAGWRVNYDRVLLALTDLVMAPYAPWSSGPVDPRPAPAPRPPADVVAGLNRARRFDRAWSGAPSGKARRRRTGMDALTRVREDHRRLEELLARCEHGHGDGRRTALAELRSAVAHHVDQEEHILYPIFRERARRAEVDLASLDQALEQHRLIDRLARELPTADDDQRHQAKLTVLAEQVRTHLDNEDSVLLTAIEDLIDDDTLLELGRRMEQRNRVVQARRELAATMTPGDTRLRRLAAAAGGLLAAAAAVLAVLVRRRPTPSRPSHRRATGRSRSRRR
jgi:hemerythrin-like domain-containing protein